MRGLGTVWSFVYQGKVEGRFGIAVLGFGLFLLCFAFGDYGPLGIQTEPTFANVLEDVGKYALF
jgi:hypothetical protein